MKSETGRPLNLLDLKPMRNARSEAAEDGLVTLFIPKFQNRWMVRWFVPMLARPEIRLKLDKYGSYLWNACDGTATVSEIGSRMSGHFGEELDPLYERIGMFIRRLDESGSLLIEGHSKDTMVAEKTVERDKG
ncbi:MAG TPA: PqqD family protein [Bacteroidota bacterium]|nr:PqqD family protein [Bacteroidota bacterium]